MSGLISKVLVLPQYFKDFVPEAYQRPTRETVILVNVERLKAHQLVGIERHENVTE
jgi:hypothetical protein